MDLQTGGRGSGREAAQWRTIDSKKGASPTIRSPHDGDGELHVAFASPAGELARWESCFEEKGSMSVKYSDEFDEWNQLHGEAETA